MYAMTALKNLPIRVQNGANAMRGAVRAARSGNSSKFYALERKACDLWRDTRGQARTAERFLDMDFNTGVIVRSDFREITRDLSRLLQYPGC